MSESSENSDNNSEITILKPCFINSFSCVLEYVLGTQTKGL